MAQPERNRNAPVITSQAEVSVFENTAVTTIVYHGEAIDDDGRRDILRYSLTGDDAVLFSIDQVTGDVRFKTSPDYEAPADLNHDNAYNVVFHVFDGVHDTAKAVTIKVTDL